MNGTSRKRQHRDDVSAAGPNTGAPRSKQATVSLRKQYIAPSCEYYYPEDPLKIVRGEGAYLINEQGVKYLDCVNNVCHVGHCNSKVVEAAAKQMSVLNTNTRYLNDNIVDYAQHLAQKLPGDLGTFFFTNSGSEANDLALQVARRTTGNKVIIAIDGAYHGHLSSLLEISSYKWNGDAKWCGENSIVAPFPDVSRGEFRDPDTAGPQYALEVKKLIDSVHSSGRKIAAFISESAMSCGGLRPFPKGYLKDVYRYVRQAGGLCIADEVQVGFGRSGNWFWMFQQQDVIPDVVTMGKPMGNGHPVSATVTTKAIAQAYRENFPSCYFNTYGGNPVSMAVAEAVLKVIEDEDLQGHARLMGAYVFSKFEELKLKYPKHMGSVNHCGLFGGIDMVKDQETNEPNPELAHCIHLRLKEHHCIIMTTDGRHDNVMKLKPPMVFARKDADYLVECFEESLVALTSPAATDRIPSEEGLTKRTSSCNMNNQSPVSFAVPHAVKI